MGYDIDRFVHPINDGLLCSICRDVLEDPVQAPCEHVYCSECIRAWLVHDNICPEDRRQLWGSDLRPLFRYMKNDLEKLQIRCKNFELGCPHVCNLGSVETHEKDCGYVVIKCPCEGCDLSFARRSLEDHLLMCAFRTKSCPKGCGGAILTIGDNSDHSCVRELHSVIELMKSDMNHRVEEMRNEMELRLDAQRRHMVKRESRLQDQMLGLQNQLETLDQQMASLAETCSLQTVEIQCLKKENSDMQESMKSLQKTDRKAKCSSHGQKSKTIKITAL